MKTEKLKKLVICLFDLWKTFPDAVKTTVLVAIGTALFAAFWAGKQSPGNQTPQTPELTNQPVTNSQFKKPHSEPPPNKRTGSPTQPAQGHAAPETARPVPALSESAKTLGRTNYAESYRQALELLRSLPEHEQRRVASQSNEAARRYERGDFREAAYIMQQAIGSTH
jgi:hypothetical protein